jgi:hypothetical protein
MRSRVPAAGCPAWRWLLWLACCLACGPLAACEYLVRDFAFRIPRDVHRLAFISRAADAESDATFARLQLWHETTAADLNVELVRIDVDDPNADWSALGIPSAPPSVPVTVLAGRGGAAGTHFLIDYWDPAPSDEDLARLADSPLRQQLAPLLAAQRAVMLYAPCDTCRDDRLKSFVENVARRRSQGEGPGVIAMSVDRADPGERVLLSFAGIPPSGDDWVAVVFGRGKLMYPPLIGAEATEAALNNLLDQVEAACSCSRPLPSLGVDLPLLWPAALDAAVVPLRIPPPEDKSEQAWELTGVHLAAADSRETSSAATGQLPGSALTSQSERDVSPSSTPMTTTLAALAAMIVLVGVVSRWMFSRS